MGREIKRVPAHFNHPLRTPWPGYLCPHRPRNCPACGGNGYSPEAKRYQDEWYGNAPFSPESTGSKPFGPDHPAIVERARNALYDYRAKRWRAETPLNLRAVRAEAERLATDCFDSHWSHHLSQADVDALVTANRLYDLTHTFTPGEGWTPKVPPYHPTAAEVNEWSLSAMHGPDFYPCVRARCERNGERLECATCDGHGYHPDDKGVYEAAEAWERDEPPVGDWWQLWETVSEGSPITPAFATPEELARWCAAHQFDGGKTMMDGEPWNSLAGGTSKLSYDQWLAFIAGPGWAPSMVGDGKGLRSGVEAMAGD